MNILLLGSGGREHALAWKIAVSPLVARLFCAPGNAGIAHDCEVVALDIADHAAVIAFCKAQKIDLVVVGPEAPLCAGIVIAAAPHYRCRWPILDEADCLFHGHALDAIEPVETRAVLTAAEAVKVVRIDRA